MFTRPDVCPVGTEMPLTRLERIQDDKEIWIGWPEGQAQFWCFAHTSVELVDKPAAPVVQSETFDQALANATAALAVIGTGKLGKKDPP